MTTENISWLLLDAENLPIVGASPAPYVMIRELNAESRLLDWSDLAFKKASTATLPTTDMSETDSTNFPGVYELEFPTTGLSGVYYVYAHYDVSGAEQKAVQAITLSGGLTMLDAVLEDTNTTIPGTITTVGYTLSSILEDTSTTIPTTIANINSVVDSILVDTATTIPATISALDTSVSDIPSNVWDEVL